MIKNVMKSILKEMLQSGEIKIIVEHENDGDNTLTKIIIDNTVIIENNSQDKKPCGFYKNCFYCDHSLHCKQR